MNKSDRRNWLIVENNADGYSEQWIEWRDWLCCSNWFVVVINVVVDDDDWRGAEFVVKCECLFGDEERFRVFEFDIWKKKRDGKYL